MIRVIIILFKVCITSVTVTVHVPNLIFAQYINNINERRQVYLDTYVLLYHQTNLSYYLL